MNNTVARAGGLLAVAVLPALAGLTGAAALAPADLASGFRTAVLIAGAACAAGGGLAALTIRNPARPTPVADDHLHATFHCGVGAPPLRGALAPGGRAIT